MKCGEVRRRKVSCVHTIDMDIESELLSLVNYSLSLSLSLSFISGKTCEKWGGRKIKNNNDILLLSIFAHCL